jgi:hypothetical protein
MQLMLREIIADYIMGSYGTQAKLMSGKSSEYLTTVEKQMLLGL